jgi:FtsP/CotA-like multicopper oxidase with cupredoxin domain
MAEVSRRRFLYGAAACGGAAALAAKPFRGEAEIRAAVDAGASDAAADYTLTVATTPIEIASSRIISTTTYNGQFPGPLLRLKEGRKVVVDIRNQTDRPEQLHWHGQTIPVDVDGAAEEGTPFIPAHGQRRIEFTPGPSGLRFYHTHVRAGADLYAGQYGGEVGPVYIEGKDEPGDYDREFFLVLKEFEPTFSRGGDMAMDFLAPAAPVKELKDRGEGAMQKSMKSGKPHGYEVGYDAFTINGRMLRHGEPLRVKQGERVMLHVVNGSAGEIRSLALPGHTFEVIAMDGNRLPKPVRVPVLWLGTAERISTRVTMNHPGVWVMGDLDNDDRGHGMGIVVEYAGAKGPAQWVKPAPFRWNYAHFGLSATAADPDETIDMLFEKDNAAIEGFNRWTINGKAYPLEQMMAQPSWHLHAGKRYRLRMRNASDDIHPIHLHRHTFEVTKVAGQAMSGLMKDVIMVNGYQEVEVDFVANNPGMTLFHCHQQLHMDFGFMGLFDYA